MGSSGLHSNGYSLVRHVLLGAGGPGWSLDRQVDVLGRTLGEELLEPTRIYAKACLDLAAQTEVHAMSHVTGGGLAANLERVMPVEVVGHPRPGDLDAAAGLLAGRGGRRRCRATTSRRTLNCGVGMVALVPPDAADRAIAVLEGHGVPAWVAGEVSPGGEGAGPPHR